jgi:hypothetical protein
MSGEINDDRRRFSGNAAMTIAASQFGMIGAASAQSKEREFDVERFLRQSVSLKRANSLPNLRNAT